MTRANPSLLLRRALVADAVASAAAGVFMAAGAGVLGPLLDLPIGLLRVAGLVLLPFAGLLVWLARQPTLHRAAAGAVIVANVLWALDSLALLLSGWIAPNGLGLAFVVAQAAVVAVLAELQYFGARRSAAASLAVAR